MCRRAQSDFDLVGVPLAIPCVGYASQHCRVSQRIVLGDGEGYAVSHLGQQSRFEQRFEDRFKLLRCNILLPSNVIE
jgi:hypothetical protein